MWSSSERAQAAGCCLRSSSACTSAESCASASAAASASRPHAGASMARRRAEAHAAGCASAAWLSTRAAAAAVVAAAVAATTSTAPGSKAWRHSVRRCRRACGDARRGLRRRVASVVRLRCTHQAWCCWAPHGGLESAASPRDEPFYDLLRSACSPRPQPPACRRCRPSRRSSCSRR